MQEMNSGNDLNKYAIADSEEEAKRKLLDLLYEKQKEIKIVRPKIPLKSILLGAICPMLVLMGNLLLFIHEIWLLIVGFLLTALFSKQIAIFWILLYQKFAPQKIRKRCRFTPSCSNYMLMAIQKYGLIKGLIKGTRRLFRCYPPNGGVDNC